MTKAGNLISCITAYFTALGQNSGVRNRVRRCPTTFRCVGNSFATEDCQCGTVCPPCGVTPPIPTPPPIFPPQPPPIFPPAQPIWANWGPWGPCQPGGIRSRARQCPLVNQCPGRPMETESCSRQANAQWQQWSPWGPCTVSYGRKYII